MMLTLGFGLTLLSKFTNLEERWNVGKEIGWNCIHLIVIGFANLLWAIYLGILPFNIQNLLLFQLYTVAIGVLPVAIITLLKENTSNRKFSTSAQKISSKINQNGVKPQPSNWNSNTNQKQITLDSGKETFQLTISDLLYIQSTDNYLEIVTVDNVGKPTKQIIRNTMKFVAGQLSSNPHIFRCHKRYIVNLSKVARISGNAQGYKLHLTNHSDLIPVSRSHNKHIKETFSAS